MKHSPISWPRLGLGCAALGTLPPGLSDAEAGSVIAAAVERGIRFFDVAPLYGGGLGEERLGRALARVPRDDYILCTKTGVTRPYGQPPMPPGATRRRQFDCWDFSATGTRTSIATSLERLRTGRLDVVHLHDAEDHLDVSLEAYAELARLRDDGIVGAIGIGSNFVEPARTLLERARFDAILLAGRYTLLDQTGRALIDTAHAQRVAVVVGGIFNSGVLAAWPQPAPTFGYEPADAVHIERTVRIAAICARHGVSLAAAALQFVLANPAVATVLIGPRTVAELEHNLTAAECDIAPDVWSELAEAGVIPADSPGFAPLS